MKKEQFHKAIQLVCTNSLGDKPYSFTYKKTVKKADEGKTLLELYATSFPYKTKEYWKEKIENGAILVNEKKIDANIPLKAGWITMHTTQNKTEPSIHTNINLVFENEDFLVINKPAPLPVHPSGRFYKNTLTYILEQTFPNINYKIVHRLDANTTGLLLLAKNKETANYFINHFKDKTIKKQYIALVEGEIKSAKTTINATIGKDKEKAGSRLLNNSGQKAETSLTVIKKFADKTLVLLEPKDGRTNQLRLHLASINHPIIGDLGYKNSAYFKDNPMTYPTDCLMLHAWKLSFIYKGKTIHLEAPIPEKFGL